MPTHKNHSGNSNTTFRYEIKEGEKEIDVQEALLQIVYIFRWSLKVDASIKLSRNP